MNQIKSSITVILLLAVLVVPTGCGSKTVKTGPEVGQKAPEITGQDLEGSQVSLRKLQGKPTLIIFWQTISVPSQRQLKEVEKLSSDLDGKINVFTINLGEESDVVHKYIADKDLNLPVLIDNSKQTWANLYRIDIMPTLFIIDKDGIITVVNKGDLPYETLKSSLEKLM